MNLQHWDFKQSYINIIISSSSISIYYYYY